MYKTIRWFVVGILLLGGCKNQQQTIITVDSQKVISNNFIGNGVQWDAYPHADADDAEWGHLMTDAKWDMVFHRLDFMKPQLVRVMDQAQWRYLKGFDKDGKPILDFRTQEVQSLEKLLDYCQKNNITVVFGEWGCPYHVHDQGKFTKYLTGANDPKWIGMITEYLKYLIVQKNYTCLKYYVLVNEPNGYWASTDGDWNQWKEGVEMLHDSLVKNGLADKISIAGPDAVPGYDNPKSQYTGYQWVTESIKQLNPIIGCYDIHGYPGKDFVRSGKFSSYYAPLSKLSAQVGKPIIFGEIGFDKSTEANQKRVAADPNASPDSQMSVYDYDYGIDMADVVIQSMNIGFDGAAAWDLDDAMHTNNDAGDKSQLKRWGMWNSLGTELCHNPADENIRPWFYTWSLMCRYFPHGTKIVETDCSKAKGIRAVTGINGNELTTAMINRSDSTQTITIRVPDMQQKVVAKEYKYTEKVRKVNDDGFPVPVREFNTRPSDGITVTLPAQGFILVTTLKD